ncbi:MAG: glucans biosynthesis glucosyltransferase MdoH [Gammaproteobacteria bacterium]
MRTSDWHRKAWRRRTALGLLVLLPAWLASSYMAGALPSPGNPWLNDVTVLVFGILTAWIAIGFWTAVFGFGVLLTQHHVTPLIEDASPHPPSKTALVFPIYKESPERIMAAVEVMYRDLEKQGQIDGFEFYILSDSDDPDAFVREQWAWAEVTRTLSAFGRIHYRRRRSNTKRKTGNIADFLRRWGYRYEYMIVLDADSLMSATCLSRMVRLMQSNPKVGIIQSAPGIILQKTLFGRIQQFSNRLYGLMYAAGLSYWQLGDSYYWGHNAIIRVTPFVEHCHLPRLRGRTLLAGDILSHDFVEAALMRRAGWSVWLVPELAGSWEETPPTLADELKRDRRWCYGNLQHLRLLFSKGLLGTHRLMFVNGAMAYVASVFWLLYLLLGTAVIAWHALVPPNYFPHGHGLFPVWPIWHENLAILLLVTSAIILFLPKILGLILVILQRRAALFGGPLRLSLSVVIEIVFSMLLAPVRMLFHSWYVISSLLGRRVSWGRQQRGGGTRNWIQTARLHVWCALVALVWTGLIAALNPVYLIWLLPIVLALLLVTPVTIMTESVEAGQRARKARLFLTPEESQPPEEIQSLDRSLGERVRAGRRACPGFSSALVDPYVNAVAVASLSRTARRYNREIDLTRSLYAARLLARGPKALNRSEQLAVLHDRQLLTELHHRIWTLTEDSAQNWNLTDGR